MKKSLAVALMAAGILTGSMAAGDIHHAQAYMITCQEERDVGHGAYDKYFASQFVHKDPEYIENWFLEVHQKELLGIKYKPVYSGRTHGEEVEKLADGSIIHKASDGNFTIEQTENHYVLKFKDAKLQYGSYSHAFEFDMEKLEKNEEESIYFDDENGIEVILRKSLEKVWSPWLW